MIMQIYSGAEARKLVKKFESFQCTMTMYRGKNWYHFGDLSGTLSKVELKSLSIRTYLKLCFSFDLAYLHKGVQRDLKSLESGKVEVHLYAPRDLSPFQWQRIRGVLNPHQQFYRPLPPPVEAEIPVVKPETTSERDALMQEMKERLVEGDFFMVKRKIKQLAQRYPEDTVLQDHAVYIQQMSLRHRFENDYSDDYKIHETIIRSRNEIAHLKECAKTNFEKAFMWIGENVFDLVCRLRKEPIPAIKEAYYKWIEPLGWGSHTIDPFHEIFGEFHEDNLCLSYFKAEELLNKPEYKQYLMRNFNSALQQLLHELIGQINGLNAEELTRHLANIQSQFVMPDDPKATNERETVEKVKMCLEQANAIAQGKPATLPQMDKSFKRITEALQDAAAYQAPKSALFDEIAKKFNYPEAANDFTNYSKHRRVEVEMYMWDANYQNADHFLHEARAKDYQNLKNSYKEGL